MSFQSKQNLQLLWDVLLDELHVSNNTKMATSVKTIFDTNLNLFRPTRPNMSTIEMNKLFLSQVLTAVNKLFPKKIQISEQEITEPYKIEDIQASRKTDFERDVELKKLEMESYLTPAKPMAIDFSFESSTSSDQKIKHMDSLLSETMSKRNEDLNLHMNVEDINDASLAWLKPVETSTKKSVQFSNDSFDILSKLKKTTTATATTLLEDTFVVEEKKTKYEEQESIPINNTTVDKPSIIPESTTTHVVTPTAEHMYRFAPQTEMIRQLNEMNQKIDKMGEQMLQLFELVKGLHQLDE